MVKFDQRAYTTPGEFQRANLALWGFAYMPNRCLDGTVASCQLNVYFGGCGGLPRVFSGSESAARSADQHYGWGGFGHKNDVITVFPMSRDACWNMESTLIGYSNDYYWLDKEGAQSKAIMRMIEKLKAPKDAGVDLTNLPNTPDVFEEGYAGEGNDSFFDNLGVIISMNF
jgi:hypothetical protein